MNSNKINYEADFVFIKNGNIYLIEKDSYNLLDIFIALDENFVKDFLQSKFKTTILNMRGEVIMQNFKNTDMKAVQELLSSAEQSYEERMKILEDIDKALDKGDKETFMRLTEELYGGTEDEHGVA